MTPKDIDDLNDEVDAAHRARLRAEAERDALALEIRRLRAAESPGTDDEAFAETGWTMNRNAFGGWRHTSGATVFRASVNPAKWVARSPCAPDLLISLALDAMRAAVPGSV